MSKRSFEFEIPAGSLVEAANKYHELAPAAILFDEVKHVEWLRARADEIRKGMIMGAAGMRPPNGHPRGN
jgi:hypothetical protein